MALYLCTICKNYRVGTYFDPMSRQERIMCVECQSSKVVKDVLEISIFRIQECSKVAHLVHEKRKKEKKKYSFETLLFVKFFFFGLGKEAPHDRNGKTISDLENEARNLFLLTLPLFRERAD